MVLFMVVCVASLNGRRRPCLAEHARSTMPLASNLAFSRDAHVILHGGSDHHQAVELVEHGDAGHLEAFRGFVNHEAAVPREQCRPVAVSSWRQIEKLLVFCESHGVARSHAEMQTR